MLNNRPGSDFFRTYQEISDFCHKFGEPLFLIKEGNKDTVVMSIEAYEKLMAKVEIYNLLGEALDDERENGLIPLNKATAKTESRLRNGKL